MSWSSASGCTTTPARWPGPSGYYIDVTDTVDEERRETLDENMPEKIAARELIEQAKGALMMAYGITAEQAFRVLIWRSQETNTKLRELAAHLMTAVPRVGGADVQLRTRFDHVLLTAHEHREH